MADTSADEFSQFPVESVARFLSVCGNEDPNLLRRSKAAAGLTKAAASVVSPRAPVVQRPVTRNATQHESYLEELVSIAIASARKAEDAARQVNAAGAGSRRRTFALSALGVAGVLAGAVIVTGVESGHGPSLGHSSGDGVIVAANGAHAVQAPAGPAAAPPAAARPSEVQVRIADVSTATAAMTPVSLPALPTVTVDTMAPAPADAAASPQDAAAETAPHAKAGVQAAAPVAVAAATPPPASQAKATTPQDDSAEAMLHANARAQPDAPVVVATATPPAAEQDDAVFVPPLPPVAEAVPAPRVAQSHEAARPAPQMLARAQGIEGHGTSPSQLVAAVEALEMLTNERPARASPSATRPLQFNNRM